MQGMSNLPEPSRPRRPMQTGPAAGQPSYGWLALLALLVVGLPLAFAIGLDGHDSLAALRRHHLQLLGFVAVEPLAASLLFMIVFALSVAISLPGVSLLTMIGGFLFGWLPAAIFAQVAATIAAALVFVLAKRAFASPLEASSGPTIRRFADGFKRNALSYVFLLNLIPVLPFGMVIALPAACGVRLWTFLIGGFLGILPGTILLSHLGAGLGDIIRRQGSLELATLLTPQILMAIAGLAALSLLPLAFRCLVRRDPAS